MKDLFIFVSGSPSVLRVDSGSFRSLLVQSPKKSPKAMMNKITDGLSEARRPATPAGAARMADAAMERPGGGDLEAEVRIHSAHFTRSCARPQAQACCQQLLAGPGL